MRIPDRFRPELCVSKAARYEVLLNPELDISAGAVIATERHMLVVLPVALDTGDVSGVLPLRALEMARGEAKEILSEPMTAFDKDGCGPVFIEADVLGHEPAHLLMNGACVLDSGITVPRKREGKFPDWIRVVPAAAKLTCRICISADYLKALADAMGADMGQVTLDFEPGNPASPVVVKPAHTKGSAGEYGVLMPVSPPEAGEDAQ